MHSEVNASLGPQQWVAERWIKHSDSASIVGQFSHRSSWNRLSESGDGHNVIAMQALAAALANEGAKQWLDATRLAWRLAVAEVCERSLVQICSDLSQLGPDPFLTPDFHGFRERSFAKAKALSRATHWVVGEHVVNAAWAKVLRNSGDTSGFTAIASELDSPRVLREVLGSEASAVQRFQVVQTLALFELERRTGASRLDWILGLLAELGVDLEAGSTAMRVLLIDSEHAVKRRDFNAAFVGALQLSNHMVNGDSELCSRSELANLLRGIKRAFNAEADDKSFELACSELTPSVHSSVEEIESLARDMDRIAHDLPVELKTAVPQLAQRYALSAKVDSAVVLPFTKKHL